MQQADPIAGRLKGGIERYHEFAGKLENCSRRRGPAYPSVQRQSWNGFTGTPPHRYCVQPLLDKLSPAITPHHAQQYQPGEYREPKQKENNLICHVSLQCLNW